MNQVVLNDRYGDAIIGERRDCYDGLEIQGVRDFSPPGDPHGTFCEVDNENPQFFSVYAHLKEGGVESVGDFGECVLAATYAQELATKYGLPIRHYVPSKHQCPSPSPSVSEGASSGSVIQQCSPGPYAQEATLSSDFTHIRRINDAKGSFSFEVVLAEAQSE